jgi:hypothetical protein
MERPSLAPAPVVTAPAAVFRDLCENQGQCRHVQHSRTGLLVLPTKSLAHIARGLLESADNTTLARFGSDAPWREDEGNRRRLGCMRQQTTLHRRRRRESLLAIEATLCEHVGSLFDDVDRHDKHGEGTSPLAPQPVTSGSVRGPVRCPGGLRR